MRLIMTLAFAALVLAGLSGCIAVAPPFVGVGIGVPVCHVHDGCCGHYYYR